MIYFDETKFFCVVAVFFIVYVYLKYYVYNYWKHHNVPHEEPSLLFGNIPASFIVGKKNLGNSFRENYAKYGHHPFHGFYVFHKPVISINDPELIRIVLVKEFDKFCDRGWFIDDRIDPMSNNLFLQNEDKWKRLKKKLTPTFTPNKLRQIYPLMKEVSNEMADTCDEMLGKCDEIEIKDILVRYTTDIISSIVYGFKCHSLKEPNNDFLRLGVQAFHFGRFNLLLAIWYPEILHNITLPFYQKKVRQFFAKTFYETIEFRQRENIVRKDFLNLLMQLVNDGELEADEKHAGIDSKTDTQDPDRLTLSEAAAQAFIFFLAGFETTSSTATYCLLELALNPDIQEKLYQEVAEVAKRPEGFTFDNVMEMEYLDMVFSETLRKYPVVALLNRIAKEDFLIPNSNYTIPKGMRIVISSPGVSHNPKYFPDPEKFDPSRFTKENLASSTSYVHLGFGKGPRNCIGKRIGIIQTKQAVATLLNKYKFRVSKRTNLPVKFNVESFVSTPAQSIYLHFEKRR